MDSSSPYSPPPPFFPKFSFLSNERQMVVIVFVICIILRTMPELAAYPHPIGYDVVNYYIPKVLNLQEQWSTLSKQFPLYLILLYSVRMSTGLAPSTVVTCVAVIVAGIFGVAIFYLGRVLFKLRVKQSVFLAIFVILQMATLRTFWDLHRDVLALTTMIFLFSILEREGNKGWKTLSVTVALTAITVAADRMIGALLCVSLAANLIITKNKSQALPTILGLSLFSILIVTSYQPSYHGTSIGVSGDSERSAPKFYNRENLIIFFLVVNCLLFVPGIIGFRRMRNNLLKIPLLVTLVGSFSWVVFPENSLLVADRWIILNGIFLSIFAGYGFLYVLKMLKPNLYAGFAFSIIVGFGAIGMGYALMPNDSPFVLYAATRNYTTYFAPATMQFNSLDIEDNENLLKTIGEINEKSEYDSIIVGQSHWRGFMELYLKDDRTYYFSDDPGALALALAQQGYHVYLIEEVQGDDQTSFNIQSVQNR
ncbi:MAG: hypothetical protein M3270_04170 [Thermoproteota archaeon]|nr:hypothetical protein [Thermoproteota archaeon]